MNKIDNEKKHIEQEFVFCSFAPVGLEDYVDYFINNFNNFTYLQWKFPHSKGKISSRLIKYQDREKKYDQSFFSLPVFNNKFFYFLFLPVNYFIYFYQAIFCLKNRSGSKRRVFMGVNYFCAFCGIVLKKLGKVDLVIYRVMDFFPLPPSGPYRLLNRIFYIFDKFCLNNADLIWFTTEGHIIGREKYGYFDRSKYRYQIIPLGVNINKFISKTITEENKYSLVYCGVISRYHLLDLLFEVIAELKKVFNNIKLNLIGSGPDENYFKDLAVKLGLEKNIIFHGFMAESDEFKNLMADNILGIAFYKDEENFMKYTEPAKVKYYLNFGVPAVVSAVPVIARELDNKKVCFAVNNDKVEIVNIIKNYINNSELQQEYRDNIVRFIEDIDINKLLDKNFQIAFK